MLKIICTIFFLYQVFNPNDQGEWNIGYIPIDSLNKIHIGKIVKIDFKTVVPAKSTNSRTIRSYIRTTDTGFILIDKTPVRLVERRKIYVDHGSYNDQYLESLNIQQPFRIYNAEILEIDEQTILFRMETKISGPESRNEQIIWKEIRIKKANLDGIFYEL